MFSLIVSTYIGRDAILASVCTDIPQQVIQSINLFAAIMTVQLRQQPGSIVVTATSDRHIPHYIRKENIDFEVQLKV